MNSYYVTIPDTFPPLVEVQDPRTLSWTSLFGN